MTTWLEGRGVCRDARLVILTRAVRTFGYGSTSVVLAETLGADGDSPAQTGVLLAVAAVGSVLASILLGVFADRCGRRASLLVSAILMAVAGLAFATSESYALLIVAAFVGTISPSTNDNTPFSGVEQAILAQTCPDDRHTTVFTAYNMTALASGALGGLAVSGLSLLRGVEVGDLAFGLYAGGAVMMAFIFLRLSPAVEAPAVVEEPVENREHADEGRGTARASGLFPRGHVLRLSSLFALDAYAGGLAVQAILALWFQQRYGVTTSTLGLLFFASNLLPALSQAVAPALAARRGLLTAMLLPHFLSNLLIMAVPLAPTFPIAAGLLLARQTLSKIDVPARQAFTAAIVSPSERTAAASFTSVARSVAVSASPLTFGLLVSGPLLAFGAPLLLGGSLAIAYDVSMWRSFRLSPVARRLQPIADRVRGRHRRGTARGADMTERLVMPPRSRGTDALTTPFACPEPVPWDTGRLVLPSRNSRPG